ncbi:AbrB/MazE/SpoVT family DNA-binding domain-containing protein [Companilactobacillus mishanensis]|uniref:AbrB family transcriptional regulator n=1 Tax=Companilactobacillus mishanensis TaxID=2486008 RepID=A0A5P0ZJF5_9LACO|nr:AbrB/MazE/SpoVT family DNA-binding domain-containing protein [Companilactobacillus mishanensis]MQS45040.1 AbrB family transcriptional regulator [Companilactobacillus mishanensis]MQS53230.1 AbrB family transcriptional regulator [Companilactobacillus mishanensis]MQS90287.1 AbrB family transcriptional regulator [Companilactobacillus mishanensis]
MDATFRVMIGSDNKITVPSEIVKKLNLKRGDLINVKLNTDGEIIIDMHETLWEKVEQQEKQYGNVSISDKNI